MHVDYARDLIKLALCVRLSWANVAQSGPVPHMSIHLILSTFTAPPSFIEPCTTSDPMLQLIEISAWARLGRVVKSEVLCPRRAKLGIATSNRNLELKSRCLQPLTPIQECLDLVLYKGTMKQCGSRVFRILHSYRCPPSSLTHSTSGFSS